MFDDIKPHIAELRDRLIKCILSILICFGISFSFWQNILNLMIRPLKQILPKNSDVIFTNLTEPFFTAIAVSFYASLLLSLPIIFYQAWRFISPGLYENEKKYIVPFVSLASVMFLVGVLFCYFLVIPTTTSFLVNFSGKMFVAMPKIGEYVGFFAKLTIAFGISFELPVVSFFLAKIGLVDENDLKGFFKYAVVLIFIFAAIMTPPDILSQILLALPLIGLYILSIYIAKFARDKDE